MDGFLSVVSIATKTAERWASRPCQCKGEKHSRFDSCLRLMDKRLVAFLT
jgi:hypothetical protein